MFEKRAIRAFKSRVARPKLGGSTKQQARRKQQKSLGTADQLKARMADLQAKIQKLQAELERVQRAAEAYEQPAGKELRGLREDPIALFPSENPGTVEGMNTEGFSQSLLISHGKSKDALVRTAVRHRMTMGDLLDRVRKELKLKRLPPSGISMARRGLRPIRRDVAEVIERLTGFAASKTNWPGGFKDPPTRSDQ